MNAYHRQATRFFAILCTFFMFLAMSSFSEARTQNDAGGGGEDIYFKTPGTISGPPAPTLNYPGDYDGKGLTDNRSILWVFIQQHFFLGSFILGVPMMAWILEIISYFRRKSNPEQAELHDGYAHEFMRIGLPFYPLTIIFGFALLGAFIFLYAEFSRYMATVFKPVLYIYVFVFFLENVLLYSYTRTWNRWQTGRDKWKHIALGGATCLNGLVIIYLANALMAFMMSPAGVDSEGRYLGNLWNAINTPLWNPLNIHRILASIMFSGAVISAYAAYQMITTRNAQKRAHYDQMGHVSIMISIVNLFILPFAGYWFAKEIFKYRQRMGVTLMGGQLSWPFIMQAVLIGLIFMTVTYYLWQGTRRMEGSERYQHFVKYMMFTLAVCFLVWATPHTIPATRGEVDAMGGAQHPVVGYYGTMAAKNTAINTMILSFGLCYIIFYRCNKIMSISWAKRGNLALILLFAGAEAYVVFVGIYGFFIPANVRVNLAFPQFIVTMLALVGGMLLNWIMLRKPKIIGPIQWGKLPTSGAFALFGLAVFISTTMVLMGYIRSSVRLDWHVTEILKDNTPWAETPSLTYAVGMVLLNVLVFWAITTLIFWLDNRKTTKTFSMKSGALPAGNTPNAAEKSPSS